MDVGSPEKLADAKGWMEECIAKHDKCHTDRLVALPTRLIEVSPLGAPKSARLGTTKGKTGSYIALSYCWGGNQPFKTTADRLHEYSENLPYEDLPKTILDAFQVTRSLGLQFIWIDSLCIIQDEKDDVAREMANMLQVYQNAQFLPLRDVLKVFSRAGTTTLTHMKRITCLYVLMKIR